MRAPTKTHRFAELLTLVNDDPRHNKQAWYNTYVSKGTGGVAVEVMKEEIEEKLRDKSVLAGKDSDLSSDAMNKCLLSTDKRIIESVLYGNFGLDRRNNPGLSKLLDDLAQQANNHQQLLDMFGHSPSATDLLTMANIMEDYIKGCRHTLAATLGGTADHRIANAIDDFMQTGRVSMEMPTNRHRKYMCSKPKTTVDTEWVAAMQNKRVKKITNNQQKLGFVGVNRGHIVEATHFIKMLRARLHKIPPTERNKSLQFPLCEVGYSDHVSRRYRIEQAVIYLIWDPKHAEVAEIGWPKLAESYTHDAGGLSHYPAGMINHSASSISAREWNAATVYMLRRPPFKTNLEPLRSDFEKIVVAAEAEAKSKQRQPAAKQAMQDRQAQRSSKEDDVEHARRKVGASAGDPRKEWMDKAVANRELTETLQEGYTEIQLVESMAQESLRLCKPMEDMLNDDVIKIEVKEIGA
ncbi:hypothetical protein E8E11_009672 [Didymella keratinophila]|nr:hypothetical protein E8E11_009672 [Didymella keratinophila]